MNAFDSLAQTMQALRGKNGCPWDREQTLKSLKPFLIEEAYEVLDTMESEEPDAHLEELGDLLFQIVFQSQIRSEAGHFRFEDVAQTINEKMRRRHPHVFGDQTCDTASVVAENWDQLKQAEREAQTDKSRFAGLPKQLPALLKAQRLGEKASRFNLDWKHHSEIWPKIYEELEELRTAIDSNEQRQIEQEFGDVVFSLVNLARHLGLDAETCLAEANDKFESRARHVESKLTEQQQSDPEYIDKLWADAKHR